MVRNSATDGYLKTSRCFAINILSAEQRDLSTRFSGPGPRDFSDLPTKTAVTGCPILVEAIAWVDCRVVDVFSGGDHEIFIGEIVAGDAHEVRKQAAAVLQRPVRAARGVRFGKRAGGAVRSARTARLSVDL